MKKILLVFDSYNYSEGSFEFVRQLNDIEPILLTAIFMPQAAFANVWSYAAAANGVGSTGYFPAVEEIEGIRIKSEMEHFEDQCRKNGIVYRLHKDSLNITLPELRQESRYSDLMIISGELFYNQMSKGGQLGYIRDAVRAAECPVLILPEKFEFPHNIILSYDASEQSVYSIKQFAYLFPRLAGQPSILVNAGMEKFEKDLPSEDYIVELATQHYRDLTLFKLALNPKKHFKEWMSGKKGALLVCGSLGRSGFSELFRKSFAAEIIKEHKIPVFVAHRG